MRCRPAPFIQSLLLLSQPGHSGHDVDLTVVYASNHPAPGGAKRIVSNASCTTNAVVPVLELLQRTFGVAHTFLATLHSVMNGQLLTDGHHHADLRHTRSAMQSMIPVGTGLAQGVKRLLPQFVGRVQAKALRVPVLDVSAIGLVACLDSGASAQQVNARWPVPPARIPD